MSFVGTLQTPIVKDGNGDDGGHLETGRLPIAPDFSTAITADGKVRQNERRSGWSDPKRRATFGPVTTRKATP